VFERDPDAGTGDPLDETADEAAIESAEDGQGSENEGSAQRKMVTVPFDEFIALKVAQEQANKAKADSETRSTTTDTADSEVSEQRQALEKRQAQLRSDEAYIAQIERAAESGNEEARAALALARTSQVNARAALEAEERTVARLELFEIHKDERPEVLKFMKDNGIKSPAVAHRIMRGGDRFETMAQENARLKMELEEAKKPKPLAPTTTIRGAAKASAERKANGIVQIDQAKYIEDMRDPVKARPLLAARRAGKLEITR